MLYTNHYNLNLPEGTDIVNPLVQDNPNYTKIDTELYNNKLRVIGNATEVKSGTTHAITRSDSDIDVIKFTATGDWVTGDIMTVDGTTVTVVLPDGTAPLSGAYIINTEVLAVLNGTRVTLYGAQKLPGYTASDVAYDNSSSDLSATNAQDAIDEINDKITNTSEVVNINSTTDQYGQLNITTSIPFISGSTFVLSASNKFVDIVAIYGSVVTIRYKNINDGSVVANTPIIDKVMLIKAA